MPSKGKLGDREPPPPRSLIDDADALFPALKGDPPEPRLRPPTDYLGRNPYSELRARAEHAKRLSALDAATMAAIDEASVVLSQRRAEVARLQHPGSTPLTDDERRSLEDGGGLVLLASKKALPAAGSPLPPLRHAAAPLALGDAGNGRDLATIPPPSLTSPTAAQPTRSAPPVELWGAPDEVVDVIEPEISADEAKSSKAQYSKHKAQKHRGYFGSAITHANDNKPDEADRVCPIVSFGNFVSELLALHPGTPSVETHASSGRDTFPLNALSVVDSGCVKAIFGTPSVVLTRVSGVLRRSSEKCPKGSPSTDPPAFLPDLCLEVTGKPATGWGGDTINAQLYLSRYSYTAKQVQLDTSCRKFPNVFQRFGVDTDALVLVSPFPLRIPAERLLSDPQDVRVLSAAYDAKRQVRVLTAEFHLPVFQGFVVAAARLTVSGRLPVDVSGSSVVRGEPLTVDLRLVIPEEVRNFSFRGVSPMLAFLDALEGRQRSLRLRLQHPRLITRRSSVDDDELSEVENNKVTMRRHVEIALQLVTAPHPLLLKLFNNEPWIALKGHVSPTSRSVRLASEAPSQRSMILWNFITLRKLVAFVECHEGQSIIGVECSAEIDLSASGGSRLVFEGRLEGTLTDEATEAPATAASPSRAGTGPIVAPVLVYHFRGVMTESAWNSVGGIPFVHLKDPVLEFSLDGATILPRSCTIFGSALVLQRGEPGVGFSSDHGYLCSNTALVDFPVDCFPSFVALARVVAPAAAAAGTAPNGVFLRDVLTPLYDPAALSSSAEGGDADENTPSNLTDCTPLQFSDLITIAEGMMVVNTSGVELITSSAERFSPGCYLAVRRGSIAIFDTLYPASGEIRLSQEVVADGERVANIHVLARLQTQHSVSVVPQGVVFSSNDVFGMGPEVCMNFVLGETTPTRTAKIEKYSGGGQLPLQLTACTASIAGAASAVAVSACDVHLLEHASSAAPTSTFHSGWRSRSAYLSALTTTALLVPPHVALQNYAPSVVHDHLAAHKESSRSLGDCLRQFMSLTVQWRSTALPRRVDTALILQSEGSDERLLQQKRCFMEVVQTNIGAHLSCGIREALLDVLHGKVAELRDVVQKRILDFTSTIDELSLQHESLCRTVRDLRGPATVRHDRDVQQMNAALMACVSTLSSLSRRHTSRRDGHLDETWLDRKEAKQAVSLTATRADYVSVENARLTGSTAAALRRGRSTLIAATIMMLRESLVTAVRGGVLQCLNHLQLPAKPPTAPGNSTCAPHGPIHQYLAVAANHRVESHLAHLRQTIRHLTVIRDALVRDESVFPSLFRLDHVNVLGGQTGNTTTSQNELPATTSTTTTLTLTVSGRVRGKSFRVAAPISPLHHSTMVQAVEELTSQLLQLYVSTSASTV